MNKNAIKIEILAVGGKYYQNTPKKWRIFRDFGQKTWRIWR